MAIEEEDVVDKSLDFCIDLVINSAYGDVLKEIFLQAPGDWVDIKRAYESYGIYDEDVSPDIYACWLKDVTEQSGYRTIIFLNRDSLHSSIFIYNYAEVLKTTLH